uniref:Uncharacterized protein n=1 Tax=Opuntia streptacantha TaxID=393608 RepID=A0A7C9D2A0_OPUST
MRRSMEPTSWWQNTAGLSCATSAIPPPLGEPLVLSSLEPPCPSASLAVAISSLIISNTQLIRSLLIILMISMRMGMRMTMMKMRRKKRKTRWCRGDLGPPAVNQWRRRMTILTVFYQRKTCRAIRK